MTHTNLIKEVGVAVNMAQQLEQNIDHYTKCELSGKIGYLQGIHGFRAANATSIVTKRSEAAILAQLGALQEVVA
tara:strand:- start:1976 stop:2200 length:225 start_codon:yes stop_codon:yes gene_type:complete